MSIIEFPWNPSNRQLRQFAWTASIILVCMGWFWGANRSTLLLLLLTGALITLFGIFAPRLVRPVFLGAMIVTQPIGWVLGELSLMAIFFGLFLPIGLLCRALGRDPLQLRSKDRVSYWLPKANPEDQESYFRRF